MHDNALTERGTTKALETYALGLADYGHQVEVAFEVSNRQNVKGVIKRLESRFSLLPYTQFEEIGRRQDEYDVGYFIKSGHRDGKYFQETPCLVHAVFQDYEPHGASYLYVSEWLARKMATKRFKPRNWIAGMRGKSEGCTNSLEFAFLPHAVDVDLSSFKGKRPFGITQDRFIILRYGGAETFDIPWVQHELLDFVEKHETAVALMVNTRKFCEHPRIHFLPTFTSESERNFLLAASDVFLHARQRGESFGLSIVEAMQAGLPILSWSGGPDRNHVSLLKDTGALFSSRLDLQEKLASLISGDAVTDRALLRQRGLMYRSERVVPRLLDEFAAISSSQPRGARGH